jgi:hypothetical protein
MKEIIERVSIVDLEDHPLEQENYKNNKIK